MVQKSSFRRAMSRRFSEEMHFFKGWMDRPKAVGAILPTSTVTARRMASAVEPKSGLPVLELGPGTGVITRAILERGVRPENLYSVEFSPAFARYLRETFPKVNVIEGDAFNIDAALGDQAGLLFDCVISAVPLLSFPAARRVAFVSDMLSRIPPGRPLVQITYSPLSPVPIGRGDYSVKHFDFIVRNIPPAQLWIYQSATQKGAAA